MPHLKHIGLTNFRVFGERTDITLAPLTILTGTNSSGKSSVLKAMQLLQENIADIGFLNFSHGEHKLGNFGMAVNRNAKEKKMVFTLPFEFQEMTEEMYMDWIYEMDMSNPLQYGKLSRLSVCTKKNKHEVVGITPWEKIDIDYDYFHRYSNLRHNIDLLEFHRYHNYSHDTLNINYDKRVTPHELRIMSVDFLFYSKNVKGLIKQIYESSNDVEKAKLLRFLSQEFPTDYELFELSELFIDHSFGLNKVESKFSFFDFYYENIQYYFGITHSNFWVNLPEFALKGQVMDAFSSLSRLYDFMEKEDLEHIKMVRNTLSKEEEKILNLFKTKNEFLNYVATVFNAVKEALKLKYDFESNGELTQLLRADFFEREKKVLKPGKSYKDYLEKAHYDISLEGLLSAVSGLSYFGGIDENIVETDNIFKDFAILLKNKDTHNVIFGKIVDDLLSFNPRLSKHGIKNLTEEEVISILKKGFSINDNEKYKSNLLKEFQKDNFYYLEAVRANTHRMYTWQSQGTAFNQILLDFVKSNKDWQLSFINHWLKEFGIGNELKINLNEFSIGASITIDDKPLADLGYGVTQFLPILIKLVTIVNYEYWEPDPSGENGWAFYDRKILYIEEPETNLHPKLQSKLADMFVDACQKFNLQIIIETHSEYLIRKLQYLTAKKEITPQMTVIHYFYDPKEERPESEPQVKQINIQTDGRLTGQFGAGFYDETARLMTAILTGETLN